MKPNVKAVIPEALRPQVRSIYWFLAGRHWRRLVESRQRWQVPRRPITFTEKLKYKMVFDRRPVLTKFADKIAVRDVVVDTIGQDFLTVAYSVSSHPSGVPWEKLPREYAIKVNHMSGGVVLVWDGAPADFVLPVDPRRAQRHIEVRPEHADPTLLCLILDHWLTIDYSWERGRRHVEWAYQDIPRGVIAEEFLRDESSGRPVDYRLYVMNGKVALVMADTRRQGIDYTDLMTPAWTAIAARRKEIPGSPVPLTRPRNLDVMVSIAEQLGSGIDFVRVDLYDLGDRVVFGELTNYPTGATMTFEPPSYEVELGRRWQIVGY